jgi:hypothetical protein
VFSLARYVVAFGTTTPAVGMETMVAKAEMVAVMLGSADALAHGAVFSC